MNIQARRLREKDMQELVRKYPLIGQRIRDSKKPARPDEIYDLIPAAIVHELNSNPRSPSSVRIGRFIELFTKARELNDSFRLFFDTHDDMVDFLYRKPAAKDARGGERWKFEGFPELKALNQKLMNVLGELNKLLHQYKWFPTVGHRGFETSQLEITEGWGVRPGDRQWGDEHFYIWWLCKSENGRWIESFRRCQDCEKWFFALAMHQAYCSDACRKRRASHSPEFKRRRADYMRKYRRDEKDREERAKENAKRK